RGDGRADRGPSGDAGAALGPELERAAAGAARHADRRADPHGLPADPAVPEPLRGPGRLPAHDLSRARADLHRDDGPARGARRPAPRPVPSAPQALGGHRRRPDGPGRAGAPRHRAVRHRRARVRRRPGTCRGARRGRRLGRRAAGPVGGGAGGGAPAPGVPRQAARSTRSCCASSVTSARPVTSPASGAVTVLTVSITSAAVTVLTVSTMSTTSITSATPVFPSPTTV